MANYKASRRCVSNTAAIKSAKMTRCFSTLAVALGSAGAQNFALLRTILTNFEQRSSCSGALLLLLSVTTGKTPGMNKDAKYACVITPAPLKEPLIYKVPDQLRQQIAVGMRVLIPLGRRKVTGIVL